jgi:hypothetical protein
MRDPQRSVLEEGLDCSLSRSGLAAAIERLADRRPDPSLGDAVFLDVRALHAVEADADVPGQGFSS